MQEYISQNLTAILLAIIGLFAVGIAVTITYKRITNKSSSKDKSNKVTQSGNFVGGDQAGRDIKK
jgi:hypothetical protein